MTDQEYRPETEYDEAPIMTNQEIWEKACERVGKWKREEWCYGDYQEGRKWRSQCEHGFMASHNFDVPCPPIGEPACVVAMLEWLICPVPLAGHTYEIF